ncbi:MAG TPA: hypothetical protein VF541_07220 [Longimicrobium sp.]
MRGIKIASAAAVAAAVLVSQTARAQATGCPSPSLDGGGCQATAQALESAVPQVGIAMAGGNPLPGTASVAGVRLGLLPRVTAGLRVGAARMTLPDLRTSSGDFAARERSELVPTVNVDAAVSLTQGLAGGVAGLGSLDLLLSAGVRPATGGFDRASLGYGAGVRLGLLRETFGTPAVNVSAMYRRVGEARYGTPCTSEPCSPLATVGEAEFGVRDVSGRVTVGKRVARVGLVAGAGYDRFTSTGGRFTFTDPASSTTQERRVSDGRWSLFGNLSLPLMVGAVTLEGGWMSGGGDPVPGYPADAAYDPGTGTLFGSLALRLSL